jgi:hypothetical protein
MDGPARAVRGLYESDYFAWVQEQVDHLRARRLDAIDFENIAEELGDLGKSEIDKIRSALAVLLMHMLKWDYQPERMTRSWDNSIAEQRRRYHQILGENPGLKSRLDEILRQAYADSRSRASPDTDLPRSHFPDVCPYTWERILERPFEYEAR